VLPPSLVTVVAS